MPAEKKMTAKEYLSQVYKIDQRIDSKLEQITQLHALATKATSVISGSPASGARNVHRMEDIIARIDLLERSIDKDIDELLDLKEEVMHTIRRIDNPEYRTVLEQRYLNCRKFEDIAAGMGYSLDYCFALHRKALGCVVPPEPDGPACSSAPCAAPGCRFEEIIKRTVKNREKQYGCLI